MTSGSLKKASEVHPELFHYTGWAGVEGILRTQSLWATHWRYLNDPTELRTARDLLPKLIAPAFAAKLRERIRRDPEFARSLRSDIQVDEAAVEGAYEMVEKMHDTLCPDNPEKQVFEFYVSSFCTHERDHGGVREHGLLSQWRAYGRDGGFALVFDTLGLEALMEVEAKAWPCHLSLGDVAYSSDSAEVVRERLDGLRELGASAFEFAVQPSEESASKTLNPALNCYPFFKHWAYSDEREVRLLAVLNGAAARDEHARAGESWPERPRVSFQRNGCVLPTIHLFEDLAVDWVPRLPIRRIIVGPGPRQDDSMRRLGNLLNALVLPIPYWRSVIPLRW